MRGWERLEDHEENVPAPVRDAAKALLFRILVAGPEVQDSEEIMGWKLTPLDLGYRRSRAPQDIMDAIVEQTAVEEMAERLEEQDLEEPGLMYETFTLGDPKEGVIILVRAPKIWWKAEPLDRLVEKGILRDSSSGNDACPSLGAELMDGRTIQIFIGHPHPEHHTRHDACDPRFAIFLGDNEWQMDFYEGSLWEGESEEEARRHILRIIEEHGGPRRQLRLLG